MSKNNHFWKTVRILGITIPFLAMIIFSVFSWIKAREIAERSVGNKVENLSENYHELELEGEEFKKELKVQDNRLDEVEKMQAVIKLQVKNIDEKTDEIKSDVKEILRKIK